MTTYADNGRSRADSPHSRQMDATFLLRMRTCYFLDTHRDELWSRYSGQWIAVEDERVLGNSHKLAHLVHTLMEMKANPHTVVIEFLAKNPPDTVE